MKSTLKKCLLVGVVILLAGCAHIGFDWLNALQGASKAGTRLVIENNPYYENDIKEGIRTALALVDGDAVDVARAGRMILDFVEKITETAAMPAIPQLDRSDLIEIARTILDALQDVISIQLDTPAKLERAREIVKAILMGAKEALEGRK